MPIVLCDPPESIDPSGARDIYLPIIATPPVLPEPVTPTTAFLALLMSDPRQQRPRLEVCAALETAALWRAHGLAVLGDPWSHRDRDGIAPNAYARRAGCRLPQDYALDGNNVESLTAGSADAGVMFNALANSASHAAHLFGLNSFFRQQDRIGIAVCEGPGEYRWYWAIFISRCEE